MNDWIVFFQSSLWKDCCTYKVMRMRWLTRMPKRARASRSRLSLMMMSYLLISSTAA